MLRLFGIFRLVRESLPLAFPPLAVSLLFIRAINSCEQWHLEKLNAEALILFGNRLRQRPVRSKWQGFGILAVYCGGCALLLPPDGGDGIVTFPLLFA